MIKIHSVGQTFSYKDKDRRPNCILKIKKSYAQR